MNVDVSVLIAARNEQYLGKTVESVLLAARANTEVIVIADGYEPEGIPDDPRVRVIKSKKNIGQRAAVNLAARKAFGRYIMKLDAHCSLAEGFDETLMNDCEYDWTVIPRMYQLDEATWEPKARKKTDFMFIRSPHAEKDPFQIAYYDAKTAREFPEEYKAYKRADWRQGELCDTMTCIGACWFMRKDRYWELGGLDEKHAHWGQMGVELSGKSWLSGGRMVVNKKTWFAHLWRRSAPWKLTNNDVMKSRAYSQDLWLNNKWPKQVLSFDWLARRFAPVPTWNGHVEEPPKKTTDLTLLYYTANVIDPQIAQKVIDQFTYACPDAPVISVSQKPMTLGQNICVGEIGRSLQNIYVQVLAGVRQVKTDYVALVEDDCLYTPSHFEHRCSDKISYNLNRWLVHLDTRPHNYTYRRKPILSQCIAPTKMLLACLEAREKAGAMETEYGEPGIYEEDRKLPAVPYETYESGQPNIVICHKKNTSGTKRHGTDAEPCITLEPWGNADMLLDILTGKQTTGGPVDTVTDQIAETTILYYTSNAVPSYFERAVTAHVSNAAHGREIISVSHKPMKFGKNICVGPLPIGNESIFRQMLTAAEAATTRYVACAESDCLYTQEHYNFAPPRDDTFYYNDNAWYAHWCGDRHKPYTYVKRKALSQLICNRELLIAALRQNLMLYDKGFTIRKGKGGACEPGACTIEEAFVGTKQMWLDAEYNNYQSEYFHTEQPNLDIRHENNTNPGRRRSVKTADTLEPWGPFFKYWRDKLLRRWPRRYGLRRHTFLDLKDAHDNPLKYCRPHNEKSVTWFHKVFPDFVAKIHEGVVFTNADFEKHPYFEYLVSKLNPADRNPITRKGRHHVHRKMREVVNLYHDIKDNGLGAPVEMFRAGKRCCLDRGARRAEILYALGHKRVVARLYEGETAYRRLAQNDPRLPKGESIHSIGTKQFRQLGHLSTDKYWLHQYTLHYDTHLGHLRNKAKSILEIGIYRGSSLLLWRDAFPGATIYGLDIDKKRPWQGILDKFGDERIEVLIGSQSDPRFLQEHVVPKGPFDIVIDDGCHKSPAMRTSFKELWPQVKRRGFYVIEDLCGNYRPDRVMWGPFVETLKPMIDEMNRTAEIAAIHFHYNIAFVEKA